MNTVRNKWLWSLSRDRLIYQIQSMGLRPSNRPLLSRLMVPQIGAMGTSKRSNQAAIQLLGRHRLQAMPEKQGKVELAGTRCRRMLLWSWSKRPVQHRHSLRLGASRPLVLVHTPRRLMALTSSQQAMIVRTLIPSGNETTQSSIEIIIVLVHSQAPRPTFTNLKHPQVSYPRKQSLGCNQGVRKVSSDWTQITTTFCGSKIVAAMQAATSNGRGWTRDSKKSEMTPARARYRHWPTSKTSCTPIIHLIQVALRLGCNRLIGAQITIISAANNSSKARCIAQRSQACTNHEQILTTTLGANLTISISGLRWTFASLDAWSAQVWKQPRAQSIILLPSARRWWIVSATRSSVCRIANSTLASWTPSYSAFWRHPIWPIASWA